MLLEDRIRQCVIPGLMELLQSYHEPHRAYHNWEHVNKIWDTFETKYRDNYDEDTRTKFFFTTVFHDIVYTPGSKFNEIKSAQEFLKFFSFSRKTASVATTEIYDTIIATRNHWDPANAYLPEWSKLFLDLDIYELGSEESVYKENGRKITKEFSSVFTERQIMEGRKAWLFSVLENKQIYWILTERNERARNNLEQNVMELSLAIVNDDKKTV